MLYYVMLLISASDVLLTSDDCHRLLPNGECGRFSEMHGALRTLHVSLNNVCTRTVSK